MQITSEFLTLETATGAMRCQLFKPANSSKRYSAILFYSEIFQITAPIARAAAMMAGQGFLVLVPEVFHELNAAGTVLAYDDAGKDKGNADKWAKPLSSYDSDNTAMLSYLQSRCDFNGKAGAMGVCIGGHLAFRAALNPAISAACCLYATDLHSNTLPVGTAKQTLDCAGDISAELLMIWGKQDPHIPAEGRAAIYQALSAAGCNFSWHEVNAPHAFMRDEGERYDPALALWVYQQARELFQRM